MISIQIYIFTILDANKTMTDTVFPYYVKNYVNYKKLY